jgi:hypothetical protein
MGAGRGTRRSRPLLKAAAVVVALACLAVGYRVARTVTWVVRSSAAYEQGDPKYAACIAAEGVRRRPGSTRLRDAHEQYIEETRIAYADCLRSGDLGDVHPTKVVRGFTDFAPGCTVGSEVENDAAVRRTLAAAALDNAEASLEAGNLGRAVTALEVSLQLGIFDNKSRVEGLSHGVIARAGESLEDQGHHRIHRWLQSFLLDRTASLVAPEDIARASEILDQCERHAGLVLDENAREQRSRYELSETIIPLNSCRPCETCCATFRLREQITQGAEAVYEGHERRWDVTVRVEAELTRAGGGTAFHASARGAERVPGALDCTTDANGRGPVLGCSPTQQVLEGRARDQAMDEIFEDFPDVVDPELCAGAGA